ncbi:MAG: conditioned medium-induced protein 4 [Haloferacaceae archaeon]
MDEKTEELRDIFIDATGEDTVTERQEESHGSLTEEDDGDVDARLRELVDTMRERYDFESTLDRDGLVTVVRGFYDDEDDADIAGDLDVSPEGVFDARMDLHLVREDDRSPPFEYEALHDLVVEGADTEEMAETLDADPETVDHYRRVAETEVEATRASNRFRDEFAELLTDSELSGRLAHDAQEDGLEEATEDIETDVSF